MMHSQLSGSAEVPSGAIAFRHVTFDWSRVYIAGVLNVTPDSFSDGGKYDGVEAAFARGVKLVEEGADWVDVGGESTRPGARAVAADVEIARVVPVIMRLAREVRVPISVDTTKAEVARAALDAGAEIVNDISGGHFDGAIVSVASSFDAAYVCGHARGKCILEVHAAESPVAFAEVVRELKASLAALPARLRARTLVDPGLGFGKGTRENLELLRRARELGELLGRPVLVGPSRKRFLGELTGRPVDERDFATVGACLAGAFSGAHVLRVHNVRAAVDAMTLFRAVLAREDR